MDLSVGHGESVALFGPNGSGKTTLVRILTSTLRPSSGSFTISGLDPRTQESEARRILGAIYHQSFLYDDLSARENLTFYAGLYGVRRPEERADALLDSVGLTDRSHDPVRSLSRGMQQRVSMARCLVHDPRVVLMDEPFTGLDPRSAATLTGTLQRLRQDGRSLLMVTHNLQRGLDLADRWVILRRGKIVGQGRTEGMDRRDFERVYLERLDEPAAAEASR